MFNLFKSLVPQTPDVRQQLFAWQGEAIVEQAIASNGLGRVRFQGTYWPAQCIDPMDVAPGAIVEVIGRDNLTLIVKAVKKLITQLPEPS